MAAPELVHNYPSDGDISIPVGEPILLYFDRGVDPETVKSSVVLFGKDFDKVSGPDSASWIQDKKHREQPYYLKSPGFKGTVPLKFEFFYYDKTSPTRAIVEEPVEINGEADEVSEDYGQLVRITPLEGTLAPEIEYTLYINGDVDATGAIGVSSRTVFDVIPAPGNSGDGVVKVSGSYTGTGDEELSIKITTAGIPGVAKYKWWYSAWTESGALLGRVSARKFRGLEDGVQIRFSGGEFAVNDVFTVVVENQERMADSHIIKFTTNDGSWTAAPASVSTPMPSAPPSSILPSVSGPADFLQLIEMTPEHGSYNNSIMTREVVLVFSEELDPLTITQDTVKVYFYPVSGHYDYTPAPKEVLKELVLDDETLIIKY